MNTMSIQKPRNVLLIDDEPDHSYFIEQILPKNIRTLTANDGLEGLQKAKHEKPDLILLDVTMPRMDGLSTCEELRNCEATRHIPVIMLTASHGLDCRVKAFFKGCDDFISKPVNSKELVARVLSKLRRIEETEKECETLVCGNLVLNLSKLEARIDEAQVPVSVLEFRILQYFVTHKDRVLSRKQILDTIWNDAVVTARTVDTHIAMLRKKIGAFDHKIKTIYGAGYLLTQIPKQ